VSQRATPMVSYEDVAGAISFLVDAFGFVEIGERITDATGRVTHAEVDRGGARVFVGWPGPDYRDPANHAATCADAQRWLEPPWVIDGVHVTVEDVDAHHARAVAAGARIVRQPEDAPPGRLYTAEDPAGHRWMFMQPPDRT